jgi:hypothetical protein
MEKAVGDGSHYSQLSQLPTQFPLQLLLLLLRQNQCHVSNRDSAVEDGGKRMNDLPTRMKG